MIKNFVIVMEVSFILVACQKNESPSISSTGQSDAPVDIVNSTESVRAKTLYSSSYPIATDGKKKDLPIKVSSVPFGSSSSEPAKVKYLNFNIKSISNDGIIHPGEEIILTSCIQNIGKGIGKELSVNISADTLIPAIDEISIWPIEVGKTRCFPIKFWVPSKAGGTYSIKFVFSDGSVKEISLEVLARSENARENIISTEKERIKKKMQEATEELGKL